MSDRARRKRATSSLMTDIATDEDHSPPKEAERREMETQVREAMSRLSDSDREILSLRYDCGLDYSEIEKVIGISQEAARKRVERGVKRLAGILGLEPKKETEN